jgi:hypothetical protein
VTRKECQHLLDTDGRLFGKSFSVEQAAEVAANPLLAERLDAFVSRFGRLQDTVLADALQSGHFFVPALVAAAERCVA